MAKPPTASATTTRSPTTLLVALDRRRGGCAPACGATSDDPNSLVPVLDILSDLLSDRTLRSISVMSVRLVPFGRDARADPKTLRRKSGNPNPQDRFRRSSWRHSNLSLCVLSGTLFTDL